VTEPEPQPARFASRTRWEATPGPIRLGPEAPFPSPAYPGRGKYCSKRSAVTRGRLRELQVVYRQGPKLSPISQGRLYYRRAGDLRGRVGKCPRARGAGRGRGVERVISPWRKGHVRTMPSDFAPVRSILARDRGRYRHAAGQEHRAIPPARPPCHGRASDFCKGTTLRGAGTDRLALSLPGETTKPHFAAIPPGGPRAVLDTGELA